MFVVILLNEKRKFQTFKLFGYATNGYRIEREIEGFVSFFSSTSNELFVVPYFSIQSEMKLFHRMFSY